MKRSTFNDDGQVIKCNELSEIWFERIEGIKLLTLMTYGLIELNEQDIRRLKDLCQFILITQSFGDKEKSK